MNQKDNYLVVYIWLLWSFASFAASSFSVSFYVVYFKGNGMSVWATKFKAFPDTGNPQSNFQQQK